MVTLNMPASRVITGARAAQSLEKVPFSIRLVSKRTPSFVAVAFR